MSSGVALNDNDRYEWLLKIKNEILKRNNNQNLVVTCSALKENIGLYWDHKTLI